MPLPNFKLIQQTLIVSYHAVFLHQLCVHSVWPRKNNFICPHTLTPLHSTLLKLAPRLELWIFACLLPQLSFNRETLILGKNGRKEIGKSFPTNFKSNFLTFRIYTKCKEIRKARWRFYECLCSAL